MSGILFEKAISLSKFRGTLVGALLGDCLGAPFEGDETVSKIVLQNYFDKMENPSFKSPVKQFTDDTVMTKAVAESFVEHALLDEVDIAKRFVTDYYHEPRRGYGEGVVTVFQKLRNTKFNNVWNPAREQFNGSGSLGNGGAMRISPVALFCGSNFQLMLDTAEKCTKITHTHKLGVNGALLQAIAVWQSFMQPPDQDLNVELYLENLIRKMEGVENAPSDDVGFSDDRTYQNQLKKIQNLLKQEDIDDDEIVQTLGNSVQAFYSVPTAIYCFLRAQTPIKSIEVKKQSKAGNAIVQHKTDNKFRRAVQFSISLGGDTDTIASMAGALAGAYHGFDYINKSLLTHCEGYRDIIKLADDLHSKTPF